MGFSRHRSSRLCGLREETWEEHRFADGAEKCNAASGQGVSFPDEDSCQIVFVDFLEDFLEARVAQQERDARAVDRRDDDAGPEELLVVRGVRHTRPDVAEMLDA